MLEQAAAPPLELSFDSSGQNIVWWALRTRTHLPAAPRWLQPSSCAPISPPRDPSWRSRPQSLRRERQRVRDPNGGATTAEHHSLRRTGYSPRSEQTSSARNLRRFRAPRFRIANGGAITGRSRGAISSTVAEPQSLADRPCAAPQPSRSCRHLSGLSANSRDSPGAPGTSF